CDNLVEALRIGRVDGFMVSKIASFRGKVTVFPSTEPPVEGITIGELYLSAPNAMYVQEGATVSIGTLKSVKPTGDQKSIIQSGGTTTIGSLKIISSSSTGDIEKS